MRVLWFTNTSSNYKIGCGSAYNGGGWISSLENKFRERQDIKLGVAFCLKNGANKQVDGNITYFPIDLRETTSFFNKCMLRFGLHSQRWIERNVWSRHETEYLRVINEFKPDIIEVFGSEQSYALIANKTHIPVVLHIQGILTPCFTAYLPPFVSWTSYFLHPFNPLKILRKYIERNTWRENVIREQEMVRRVKYFIGRTDWDERVTKTLNPKALYYYGSEVLRPEFYMPIERKQSDKFTIITTVSQPLYKGFDLVLNTAYWLKQMKVEFEWKVYGNIDPTVVEWQIGRHHNEVGVSLMGVASSVELHKALTSASVYVHPSYIDNSPNSLCEAQIMGCPVVATNIGGIPSLVTHGETGFLVPSNDPYQMAYLLGLLQRDAELAHSMGMKAREVALERHNPDVIIEKLIHDYKEIIKSNMEMR